MTTNDKTRTEAPGNRPGLVGRGFQPRHNEGRGSAFRSRRLFREPSLPGFSAQSERHRTFLPAAPPSRLFAVSSPKTPKTCADYSTLAAERNASQVIENNENHDMQLDTTLRTTNASFSPSIAPGCLPQNAYPPPKSHDSSPTAAKRGNTLNWPASPRTMPLLLRWNGRRTAAFAAPRGSS